MKPLEEIFKSHQYTLYYKKDKSMIKNAWLNQIKEKEVCSYLDYYFISMAKIAVLLLNNVSDQLYLNHCCHKTSDFTQTIADNKARDYCELYRYGFIQFDQLKILLNQLESIEVYYFVVRMVYPSFYFGEKLTEEQLLHWYRVYKSQLDEVFNYLNVPRITY